MKDFSRREFLHAGAAGLLATALPSSAATRGKARMYGLISKFNLAPGRRSIVVEALLKGVSAMPGCLSYVVAEDLADANAIGVTEVWDSKESHSNSLKLSAVQEAIKRAKPYITGFGERIETTPVGGYGLAATGYVA